MAKSTVLTTAFVAASAVLALSGAAFAQSGTGRTPSASDLELCNREAEARLGGSAASGSASPSLSGATGAAGATGETGALSGGSTLGSSGATTSGDLQARGTTGAASTDPAFQQAYRSCMQRRGF